MLLISFKTMTGGEEDNITVFDGRGFGYSYYSALIGVTDGDGRAVYDWDKMIDYLVAEHDFSYEEAVDYASYNALGACNGNSTPIIIYPLKKFDTEE